MKPGSTERWVALRYFYALIGVLAVSAALGMLALALSHADERKVRERLNEFHLRSTVLVAEATNGVAEVRQAIAEVREETDPAGLRRANRAIDIKLVSIDRALQRVGTLHDVWQDDSRSYAATVDRAGRQSRELRQAAILRPNAFSELGEVAAKLHVTLYQLHRLHSLAAEQLLAQVEKQGRRVSWQVGLAIGGVLLIASLLVARILFLLHKHLREQERMERELVERERQLRQSSKLEALGSLAGGIAHDFNNMLTAILGHTEWLQEQMDPADPRRAAVEEVRVSGERAVSLTQQLLTFGRQQPVELQVVEPNRLIADLEPMLRRLIREDIELVLELDREAYNVEVDPRQIEQVLINLAVNARDAMPEGGRLTLQTTNHRVDAETSPQQPHLAPGAYLQVRVEDTGHGMAPELLPRVFDPFFTTKQPGKGTGLGLSTVHGIVSKNRGQVHVRSTPGAGTQFEVYLPRCDRPTADPEVASKPVSQTGGSETVLVAEDDPQIRRLIARALGRGGYRVLEAGDGSEALRLCAEHGEPIHLIVTDVVMPGMRGHAMVERAREFQPAVRAVYISGYPDDEMMEIVERQGISILAKPFRMPDLLALVRRELDRSGDDGPTSDRSDS